ncbi:MAG: hypothetical protein K9K76_10605 [Halanaerobiales bacterium]|nr:hypothetical protein [Halanaerobiales bacterium]
MENYAMIEHFELIENGNIEGIKCDYFQGNQGNILIPREQIIESINIKNAGGFAEIYEEDYYNELCPNYVETHSQTSKYDFEALSSTYLNIEGLRKVIEITKEDPGIISDLDL